MDFKESTQQFYFINLCPLSMPQYGEFNFQWQCAQHHRKKEDITQLGIVAEILCFCVLVLCVCVLSIKFVHQMSAEKKKEGTGYIFTV